MGHERNFRCQAPYVSYDEVENVLEYTNEYYDEYLTQTRDVLKEIKAERQLPLDIAVLRLAIIEQTISIALIQRTFSVSFNQAAESYEWLLEKGYVIKKVGKKPVITMTMEQFEEKFKKYVG